MLRTLALLLLLSPWLASCEDNGVIAPSDGELVVSANPGTVVIDEAAGETEGTSSITAQLFDADGYPLEGVQISFSTTGGTLASAAAGSAAQVLETDANGVVSDTLTLTLADDNTVTVTARSGKLSGTTDIDKTVSSGNVEPEAFITATPQDEQRKTLPVTFSGVNSDDPDGQITCWKWTITSSEATSNLVSQGPSKSTLIEAYGTEQTLSVLLEVSDDPDPNTWCFTCEGSAATCGADDSYFSPYSGTLDPPYEIVCDLTAPTAVGGPDRTVTLAGGTVSVNLDGSTSSDPESGIVEYRWSCGNSQADQISEQATCTYTSAATYTATLTTKNGCDQTTQDTVRITVVAP